MSSTMRLSVIGLMLLSAVVLGMIGYNMSRSAPVAVQSLTPPPLQTSYFVAAHRLNAGTLARNEDFATRSVPAGSVPPGAIVETSDGLAGLRGSLIRNFIDNGNPITADDVLRPRDRGFLASVLQPGTRAVSIAVDAVSGVSGLVWPGDHVDVVLTHQMSQAAPARRNLSETIMSDIQVIAIDQEIVQGAPSDNSAAGKVVRTVTLQVSPPQVEKITVAQSLGKLALSIRAAMDRPDITQSKTTFAGDVSPTLQADGNRVVVVEGTTSKEWVFGTTGGAANER